MHFCPILSIFFQEFLKFLNLGRGGGGNSSSPRFVHLFTTSTLPIIHFVWHPKFCISIVFNFSWGLTAIPREIENNVYAKFWAGKQGVLWEMWKWRMGEKNDIRWRIHFQNALVRLGMTSLCFSSHIRQLLWFSPYFHRYMLYVNTTLLYTGIYDFVASPMVLHDPFYVGGIPSNKSSQAPYALCFKGGMKNLIIDSRYFKWNKPFNGRAL